MPKHGYRHTEEAREKMRLSKIGFSPWHAGKTGVYSQESLSRMSSAKAGKFAEQAPRWLGMSAKYSAKHMWIRKHYGRASLCEASDCKNREATIFNWANISGLYLRGRDDYKQLCPSCHKIFDLRRKKALCQK